MKIHIGTSGWHYKHWLGVFHPAGTPPAQMFQFYAQRFGAIIWRLSTFISTTIPAVRR